MPKKILFVCSGNSCRSPMAAGMLQKMLGGRNGFEIISAGTTAVDGIGAAPYAVRAMKKIGIDISGHVTKRLTDEMVAAAALIIVMTGDHKTTVVRKYQAAAKKVHLLAEYDERGAGGCRDIADPVNQPEDAYERCVEEMRNPLENLAIMLVKGEV